MRKSIGFRAVQIIGLVLLFFIILFPFYWIAVSSFKPTAELLSGDASLIPKTFTLDHYKYVLFETNYAKTMLNSLIVAGVSTLIGVVLALITAFSFSDFVYRGRAVAEWALWLASMFPGVLLMIPTYILMAKYKLINSLWSLIIIYITLYVPFGVFTMKNFFVSIPKAMREAAYIDGASKMQVLFKIIVPISVPGIVTVSAWMFILSWSEYLFGLILINDPAKKTVVVSIADWMAQYDLNWGALTAGSVLIVLPIIILFAFLGRGFIKGLTSGAVKG